MSKTCEGATYDVDPGGQLEHGQTSFFGEPTLFKVETIRNDLDDVRLCPIRHHKLFIP